MLSKIIKTYRGLTANCWNIALCDTPVDDTIKGKELRLRWLKHKHKESWFADPFILRADDEVVEFLVDAKGYRYPFIARILKGLRSLTKNKKAV